MCEQPFIGIIGISGIALSEGASQVGFGFRKIGYGADLNGDVSTRPKGA